jgi:hypothetical protein
MRTFSSSPSAHCKLIHQQQYNVAGSIDNSEIIKGNESGCFGGLKIVTYKLELVS